MKPTLYGVDGNDALFNVNGKGVIVNTRSMTASVGSLEQNEVSRFWLPPESGSPVDSWAEVARSATSLYRPAVTVVTAAGKNRAYTVPKNVRDAAKRGLEAARRDPSVASCIGRHVGRLLASGDQVDARNVHFVSRFFANHVKDETNPHRWEVWGGDAGARWAASTVEKNALTASGDVEVNLMGFYDGDETNRTFWTEKPDPNGEYVTGLYSKTPQNTWLAWGDGDWVDSDAPTSPSDEHLVELDDDTAVYVAGALYDAPDTPVSLRDYDPETFDIVNEGIPGVDWDMVDRAMTPGLRAAAPPATHGDKQYTPEERSKNASSQLRDKNGRFAEVGGTGTMKSGMRATITTVNPVDNSIIVAASDGHSYAIPPKEFEVDNKPVDANPDPGSVLHNPADGPAKGSKTPAPNIPPLDLSGILGEPRATTTTPKAWLPKLLQPMGAGQLKQVVDNYEKFIKDERQSKAKDFPGGDPTFSLDDDMAGDAPIPVDPSDEKPNPDTSDVKPLHLAIVDHDDPQAVTDLVALVPSTSTSSTATAYRRVAGAWVEDVKILQEMKSPTPPPVVQLDDAMYGDVLKQVDSSLASDADSDSAPEGPAAAPAAPASPAAPATAPVQAAGDFKLNINMEPAAIWGWTDDGQICAILAAGEGGLDRNRGNAERLRRYWLYGPGALKIRWNTGGDWTRCVRHLSKYLGPRAKGYCALRHHEATGMWTGDKRHREEYGVTNTEKIFSSTEDIVPMRKVLTASSDLARVRAMKARVYGVGNEGATEPDQIPTGPNGGRAFKIPLIIPEGLESGDGRTFNVGALSMRSLPLPLLWQIKTGDGHDGSVLVGRIDSVERTSDGLGNATGVFDTGPYGQEAQRLVGERMLRWVSADLDRFEAEEVAALKDGSDHESPPKLKITKGRLMGATLVPKPAFQECTIELVPDMETALVEDGTYVSSPSEADAGAIVAAGQTALRIPVSPPADWFDNPMLAGATPLTVDEDGRVFGHIATWDVSHIGLPNATRAPRSASNYAYFHTGVVRTDTGKDVGVGQLTLAGGHADITADAALAVKHYDDTGSAVCDVHAGEDAYGIWVAGALRPGTTPEQIRTLRASAPSGDWRVINGRLELVAVCQVNVPGFPVTRAQVASGAVYALVAAGAQTLAHMKADPITELNARIRRLEEAEKAGDQARAMAASAKLRAFAEEKQKEKENLENVAAAARARVFKVLDVDGYLTEFKDFSEEKRKKLSSEGKALKDGSFPIENGADLRRAVQAYGRAEESKKPRVRRHIVRRARALDKSELIPKDWSEAALLDMALDARDHKETLTAAALSNRLEKARNRVRGAE